MTAIKERLDEAADYLDQLYEGSMHIPHNLVQSVEQRGLVSGDAPGTRPIAQFFYGGAAEVFLALGPAVLPLLSRWLRTEALANAGDELHTKDCTPHNCEALAASALADHVLKSRDVDVNG